MQKIMICDDDDGDLQRMKEMVLEYQVLHEELFLEISTCSSAAELVIQIQTGVHYDLYILDILMPEYGGIDLGKVIREYDTTDSILYTTSSTEHALGAFGVYAEGYLLKPVEREALFYCMDRSIGRTVKPEEPLYELRTKEGIIGLDTGLLVWVENNSRIMQFYMKDGSVKESVYIRRAFETELKALLLDPRYLQPHQSFVINMQYVKQMRTHDFYMADGAMIPISRNKVSEARKRYLEYLSKAE
ncbi:MAG: LytTR family DNA-binding domain-containing protein [Hungatella sp.]